MHARLVSNRGLAFRLAFTAALAVVLSAIAAPSALAAKKAPPSASHLVDQFLSDIDRDGGKYEAGVEKAVNAAQKIMDRAVDRISIREVLKSNIQADKALSRGLRAYSRSIDKGETRTLKALSKVTLDPQYALEVRMAAAQAQADAQSLDNSVRNDLGDRMGEAIDGIEAALDELRGDAPDPTT